MQHKQNEKLKTHQINARCQNLIIKWGERIKENSICFVDAM